MLNKVLQLLCTYFLLTTSHYSVLFLTLRHGRQKKNTSWPSKPSNQRQVWADADWNLAEKPQHRHDTNLSTHGGWMEKNVSMSMMAVNCSNVPTWYVFFLCAQWITYKTGGHMQIVPPEYMTMWPSRLISDIGIWQSWSASCKANMFYPIETQRRNNVWSQGKEYTKSCTVKYQFVRGIRDFYLFLQYVTWFKKAWPAKVGQVNTCPILACNCIVFIFTYTYSFRMLFTYPTVVGL